MELHTYREETPWGELVLQLRWGELRGQRSGAALILGGTFLMDSDSAVSEQAMATRGLATLREIRSAPAPPTGYRVLLGGLWLGLTLRELLAAREVGCVQVVEVFAPVVDWNRNLLRPLNGGVLEDPRVCCRVGDLLDFLAGEPDQKPDAGSAESSLRGPYDLLLLDIDNGPTWLSLAANRALYTSAGLGLVRRSMAPGSVAVFWATERAGDFERLLAGLPWGEWRCEELTWRLERGERTLCYYLYFLVRRA